MAVVMVSIERLVENKTGEEEFLYVMVAFLFLVTDIMWDL